MNISAIRKWSNKPTKLQRAIEQKAIKSGRPSLRRWKDKFQRDGSYTHSKRDIAFVEASIRLASRQGYILLIARCMPGSLKVFPYSLQYRVSPFVRLQLRLLCSIRSFAGSLCLFPFMVFSIASMVFFGFFPLFFLRFYYLSLLFFVYLSVFTGFFLSFLYFFSSFLCFFLSLQLSFPGFLWGFFFIINLFFFCFLSFFFRFSLLIG